MKSPDDAPSRPKSGGDRKPVGATYKMAQEARAWAKGTGELPHEILLNLARGRPVCIPKIDPRTGLFKIDEETGEFERQWVSPGMAEVIECAKAAAPYFAPKISTVEVITGVSDDDLDAFIERSASEAGFSLSPGGESPENEEQEPEADEFVRKPPESAPRRRRVE